LSTRRYCTTIATSISSNSIKRDALDVDTIKAANTTGASNNLTSVSKRISSGPSLKEFIFAASDQKQKQIDDVEDTIPPYLLRTDFGGNKRRVYFETYGCQMNSNDTEIAWSILQKAGFTLATNVKETDVILVMTCAIREGAEQKIWNRLEFFKSIKRRRLEKHSRHLPPLKIGILGCMAERLKEQILEREKQVDLICGPDAYKDLPRMLSVTESGQAAVNVLLSLDETYADVMPVRINTDSPSAFVSIMRGCDNMCTYCIVPFTRGRERSRPIQSIVEEIRQLSDQVQDCCYIITLLALAALLG